LVDTLQHDALAELTVEDPAGAEADHEQLAFQDYSDDAAPDYHDVSDMPLVEAVNDTETSHHGVVFRLADQMAEDIHVAAHASENGWGRRLVSHLRDAAVDQTPLEEACHERDDEMVYADVDADEEVEVEVREYDCDMEDAPASVRLVMADVDTPEAAEVPEAPGVLETVEYGS
jgi:hypothetical protein